MITLESYVCGTWRTGTGAPQLLYNPATEEPLAQCSSQGLDFRACVQHGREVGGPALRELGFARRAALLGELSKALHARRDELLELAIRNGGNTRGDAKFDVDGATGTLAAYAALGKDLGDGNCLPDGEGIQLGRTPRWWGQHVRVPRVGVAVHVNAFNFPAWGMAEKLACALLAGVPVIQKPGTPSALLAFRIAQLIVEGGVLPEGAFQFIAGSAGDLLTHLGAQDCVAFTGSSSTGALLKATGPLLRANVRVSLEADSLNAAVLAPDVEPGSEMFTQFVTNVVLDMTQKAGQKCTAVRRILVPQARVEDVVARLVERLSAIKVGDPALEGTNMGPLASAQQLADVRAGIGQLARVARTVCGGPDPVTPKGFFVAPTLLAASDVTANVVHEREVFGPVATVLPYDGEARSAIALANRGGGGLVASLYSDDAKWTEAVVLGIAPWHGRVWTCSEKLAGQALAPGAVLPLTVHGGPGRAGGGEELGGLRGLDLYLQRTAVQGFKGFVERAFGKSTDAPS